MTMSGTDGWIEANDGGKLGGGWPFGNAADVFAEGEEITWMGYNSEVNLLTGYINYFYGDVVTKIVFTLE